MRALLLLAACVTISAPAGWAAGPPLPDAQLLISIRGGNYHAGDRVRLTIEVSNSGGAALPSVPVVLTVDGDRYDEWVLPKVLGPSEKAVWRTTYVGTRGMHLLAASADPLDDIPELSKSNNSAFINIGIGDERPPFPWLGLLLGVFFFVLGMGAGGVMRRPHFGSLRRTRSHGATVVRRSRSK